MGLQDKKNPQLWYI